MESETDEALLQRVAQGDVEALLAFYDRGAPLFFSIARHILEDERKAGEAVRDAFLIIRDQAGPADFSRKPVLPWAAAIVRNCAIQSLRASRRRVRPGEVTEEHLLDITSTASDSGLPESLTARAELVRRALRSMPDEQRKCIEWAFVRGFNHLQLAELAGVPEGAVKTSIRRGLLRLRDILEGGVG